MLRKPEWIKKKIFYNTQEDHIKKLIKGRQIHTVCQEARCPNMGECFSNKTATFLLLGNVCTRNCKFCNIDWSDNNLYLDKNEPYRVAKAVDEMGLKYVVLTSVTRDDLSDGGVSIFLQTIKEIKKIDNNISIEVLIPDFNGNEEIINKVVNSDITVFNHNMETIKRLYPEIRSMANYYLSLKVLRIAKRNNKRVIIKTGIMVGLGETREEINELMDDFYNIGGDVITIGQYLQPGKSFYPVKKYITPDEFARYQKYGFGIGLKKVIAGPFVRSSYNASKIFSAFLDEKKLS